MLRLAVAFLCVLPLLPAAAAPDFALVTRHGRLHLVTPPGDQKVHVDLDAYWPWEGAHTHIELQETEYGATLHAAVDISGPYWLYIDIEQGAAGICLHARHSNAVEFEETWWFDQYSDLQASAAAAIPYLRTLIERSGRPLIDLDELRRAPSPCDDATAKQTLALVKQLNDDKWSVRENACHELHALPYKDHVVRLTRSMRLTAEQRLRLADLIDVPEVELPPSVAAGVAALSGED